MNTILHNKNTIIDSEPGRQSLARHLQQQGVTVKVYKSDLNKEYTTGFTSNSSINTVCRKQKN